jgi:hypothetical protein
MGKSKRELSHTRLLNHSSMHPDYSHPCRSFPPLNLHLPYHSKPIASICHPPTCIHNGNRREYGPPEGQRQVRHQAQSSECEPKNLLLHDFILAGTHVEVAAARDVIPQLQIAELQLFLWSSSAHRAYSWSTVLRASSSCMEAV